MTYASTPGIDLPISSKDQSPIAASAERLQSRLSALHVAISRVEDSMHAVLGNPGTGAGKNAEVPAPTPGNSPITLAFGEAINGIDEAVYRINQLIQRCEL